MITVCLYGDLRRFGRRFDLHVETPAEALRALLTQLKGWREHVGKGSYRVRFNGRDQREDGIADEFRQPASGILHIVPRTAGAGKGGVGQIILGIVLIVVSFIPGLNVAVAGALLSAGIGLTIGGVAQLLTRPPKLDMGKDGLKASRNTAFSNLDNTAAQGQPVPLAYGLVYCGSRVVSQGVESRRVSTNGDPVLANPEAVDVVLRAEKTHITGMAAKAPDGKLYNTDFNDDSVRARNYTATLKKA